MECPRCHSENGEDSRFCRNCATPLNAAVAASLMKTIVTPLAVLSKGSLIAGKYRIIEEIGRGGMGVVYKAEAKEVDHRSDIYSLGVILYEMATSHVPFAGETALSIAMKHKGEVPKNPKQPRPGG